ncbi:MYXO-CTERM sorting domain-containing protein [Paraliomyxa miuraensis]|uniref:MYXO-CTERM sorting domain-containing protein n=1 Tax=Paraliomyxa miuraensis TaxID=376150 RepID=UPI00225176A7|nr:MYXO-CTERM sorting domain-containing protein [Paraliomyxa miuraensis]
MASAIGVMLLAGPAAAGNGTKPRITVDWSGAPCMTIVDRSADPVVHMDYAISQEDTDLTEDEVSDSRTHQFFALCRAHDPQSFLPRWITQDDLDRAAAIGSAPTMVDAEDMFETSTTWADCWFRITPDDQRLPITFAQAAMGVDWDTSAVPAGTYIIDGYTFEPAINVWSERPGVVKVVDDPALPASGPALAINNTEEVLNKNEPVTIEGCVSAMDGSTITAYWGLAELDVQWQPFLEDDPVAGSSFALEFLPPEALAGETAMIRVDVTDPMGRSYTNYMRELVIVLGTEGPGSCNDGGGFIGGAGCGGSGDSGDTGDGSAGTGNADDTAGTAGDATGNTTPGQDGGDGGGGQGCGCATAPRSGPQALALGLLLGLFGLRRRKALG